MLQTVSYGINVTPPSTLTYEKWTKMTRGVPRICPITQWSTKNWEGCSVESCLGLAEVLKSTEQ